MRGVYLPDPGGVFQSDTHRRTLGHLGDQPLTLEQVHDRVRPDVGTDFDDELELVEVLQDMEADGHASLSKDGWKMTKKGLDALTGPNGNEA